MEIQFTSRHFKAHETLRTYAYDSLKKLERYYNGILSASLVLSYEKTINSVKVAELHVAVHGTVLKSTAKSDDFVKSIDAVVGKVERQIQKYKAKQREKKKRAIRRKQAKE